MKRPRRHHLPHMPALYELDRLADESVDLAEQIKAQVARLREQDTDTGDRDDEQ